MVKKRKMAIGVFIILLILISIFYYGYIREEKKSKEQKYLTTNDIWENWDENSPYQGVVQCKFKSYSIGDIITIEDVVDSIHVIHLPEIEINKTNSKMSKALYKNVTYTLVGFKSGSNLSFMGNKEKDFPVDQKVKFTVTVKKYDFIPIHYELYGGEMIEEFYYKFHVQLLGVLYSNAKLDIKLTLDIEQKNDEKAIINITNINHTCDGESFRIILYRNNSKIDEIIPNKKIVNGINNYISYEFMDKYYHDKIKIGDKLKVTDNSIGNQTYRIEFYWCHIYPIENYDKERLIHFIDFQM